MFVQFPASSFKITRFVLHQPLSNKVISWILYWIVFCFAYTLCKWQELFSIYGNATEKRIGNASKLRKMKKVKAFRMSTIKEREDDKRNQWFVFPLVKASQEFLKFLKLHWAASSRSKHEAAQDLSMFPKTFQPLAISALTETLSLILLGLYIFYSLFIKVVPDS